MKLKYIFRAIKPFLGDLDVRIDRRRQIITFKRNGQAETMTVAQLFDEIESTFSKARPAAQITLDPFGGGTIDRISPPGGHISPPGGFWLSNCNKPVTNPLCQALT